MRSAVAEHPRPVTPSRRVVLAKSFVDLTEALDHAMSLAAKRLGYSITLRDNDSAATGCKFQIVDQDHVFADGQFGVAVVVPCPPADSADMLARSGLNGEVRFEPVAAEHGGCFTARCGTDIKAAKAAVERLLAEAKDYVDGRFWTVISRTHSSNRAYR